MKRSIEEALEVARRDRPERLPSGFADGVLRRIAEASVEYRVPLVIATKAGFLTSAALAVLAAVMIGQSESHSIVDDEPPRAVSFGVPSGMTPIGRP